MSETTKEFPGGFFECGFCKGTFSYGTPEDFARAIAEKDRVWGAEMPLEECRILCRDCYFFFLSRQLATN